MPHCLRRRTACKIQNGRQRALKWPMVSGKVFGHSHQLLLNRFFDPSTHSLRVSCTAILLLTTGKLSFRRSLLTVLYSSIRFTTGCDINSNQSKEIKVHYRVFSGNRYKLFAYCSGKKGTYKLRQVSFFSLDTYIFISSFQKNSWLFWNYPFPKPSELHNWVNMKNTLKFND